MSDPVSRAFVTDMEHAHGRQLRRFLASRLKNAVADTPDLIQEIFLRLLRIKDLEAIRSPQAYLFTVASHVLREHMLKESARPDLMDPLDVASHHESQGAIAVDPAEELDVQQRLEKVDRDLAKISPRASAILIMYRCEGMTLMEIGERLGVSHSTVRKYLTRAIAYCDERLEEME
jgi:RNA polymerase sigma-70 factor (ECF subfamily)